MMAMVFPVLRVGVVVTGKKRVQTPLCADHRCEFAWQYVDLVWVGHRGEVVLCNTCEPSSLVQLPRLESARFIEAPARVGLETPAFILGQIRCPLHDVLPFSARAEGLVRGPLALEPVCAAQAHHLIRGAVIP